MTRIELRLKKDVVLTIAKSDSIITSEAAQDRLLSQIDAEFSKVTVKVKRGKINLLTACDKQRALVGAMEYIRGDESLLPFLMSHRSSEVLASAKLWKSFISKSKKEGLFQSKPQLSPKLKPYLSSLSPREILSINHVIANYNSYDRKWYSRKLLPPEKRSHQKLIEKDLTPIMASRKTGVSLSKIGTKYSVTGSAIGQYLKKRGVRYHKIKSSPYLFRIGK